MAFLMLHSQKVTNSVAWQIGLRERTESEVVDNNMEIEAIGVMLMCIVTLSHN